MITIHASKACLQLDQLIDHTVMSHQPVQILGRRRKAVLLSAEDWRSIQETLYLLSVSGMQKSIKKSMAEPIPRGTKKLKW